MKRKKIWVMLFALTLLIGPVMPPGAQGKDGNDGLAALDGTWLAEQAESKTGSSISRAWESVFTIKDGKFQVTHFEGSSRPLNGTLTSDPAVPGAIDIKVDEIDLSEIWEGVKYPSCTLPGIYKTDDGHLTICFETGADRHRPTQFVAENNRTTLLTLARAGADFKGFPSQVSITVRDAEGKTVAGASVFSFMRIWHGGTFSDVTPPWKYYELGQTGPDGVAKIKYDDLSSSPIAAQDAQRKTMAITRASPALLRSGTATVALLPECHIQGTIQCDELTKAGKELGWTNVYLLCGGQRIASCDSKSGKFEFIAPAGGYTLNAYGEQLRGRNVDLTVPSGQTDFQTPAIPLTASQLVLLKGRPAPELQDVIGWKGSPVKLADLKGKYVLLDFWGYWCGPCVQAMPVLIKLHEQFKDKGLAIVGVHLDTDGDVDTAAKLDEKLAGIRHKYWDGKDLPFSVALTSGKPQELKTGEWQRGGAAAQYGILAFPTTVLIDREGNVVGQFYAQDEKKAVEEIQKLLDASKKN